MANRYWVGGTGTWDASSTTNWSATSGGAGGASAPTSVDDVFFDMLSNLVGYTITVGTNAVCNSITVSAPASGVAAFSLAATSILSIYGSMLLNTASSTWTGTSGAKIDFRATTTGKTITTNGISLIQVGGSNQITFNGVGGEWILGSALTGPTISISSGIFRTNNFNVVAGTNFIYLTGTQIAREIYLGSSTVTVAGATGAGSAVNALNIVFDAGTSTINCTNSASLFVGGGLTYYNVSFTSTGANTSTITGANTFNNLTIASTTATSIKTLALSANQTVNGTLTFGTANTTIRRIHVRSDIVGTPRTITLNGSLATLADVDFLDIATAGTVGTWTGTRLGNCGGNSGITFSAPKTVYWNLDAGGNFASNAWALTSNGTPDVNNFPLAQDTIVFDNDGLNSGVTVFVGWNWQLGTITFSTRTLPMGFDIVAPIVYGDITLSSAVTISGSSNIIISGAPTQVITSSGKSFSQPININKPVGANFSITDNFTTTSSFTLTQGTVSLNNNNLTASTFTSSSAVVRSIAFGTGAINLIANNVTVWNTSTATNLTYTGTPTVNFTYSGAVGTRTIGNGQFSTGSELNAITINITAGTDIVSMPPNSGGNYVRDLNFTGFSGTYLSGASRTVIHGDVIFSPTMTISAGTDTTTFAKSSGIQTITSNGKTVDNPVIKSGTGILQLLDNLTQGATRSFNFTAGGIDLNGNDLTVGTFSTTGATARNINHGTNGDLKVLGTTFTASGSNLTTSGTGLISMDSASTKTFAGGGFTYKTLNQGGAGGLIITGANTFADITNTNATASTITFPANTVTSVNAFTLSGSSGNLVSIQSSSAGTQFTLTQV